MPTFPVQYSMLSSKALQDFIIQQYGDPALTCRLLLRNVSDTYIIEKAGAPVYIFKVYRISHRSLHEIQGEVELLNRLHEGGAAVSYPIPDLHGNEIQDFNAPEGLRHGVLFSYAKGSNVYDLTEAQLQLVGREMAKVHNITANLALPHEREEYDINRLLLQPLEILAPAFKDHAEGYTYLKDTAQKVIQQLNELPTGSFSHGYLQYDFLPKNFHFDEQGQLTFFDFDFAGKGWLANDVTSFFIHFFLHVGRQKMTQEAADRDFQVFIDAYRSVRPFSDDELKAVPYLGFIFWIFYLGYQYTHFEEWSNWFFTPRYLTEQERVVRMYVELHCRFN
ncbi:Ser/Thr protein kinase RdoA involved in Cpx stress response, MazF antagonist [Chitinophaga rupis]|uniref:Ser/Thr protein kinase RdoA involved in Cpx stress response, MazF antagonist n=1 Tax=Chitinophaga rupis TaxID=573321 RepID=A0A1H7RQC0_9BACT|nr:phosphotransferase [Chitinophaga rupis]SEL61597.1 Ser/Thr protein kinase RdoA involved in Cpx stress response, MazF antagonist [Chitinophaga rupis]